MRAFELSVVIAIVFVADRVVLEGLGIGNVVIPILHVCVTQRLLLNRLRGVLLGTSAFGICIGTNF